MPEPTSRPRVLSGIQPTGASAHLGNYLGALKNWVGLQDSTETFYFVADLHAITAGHDPKALRDRTRGAVAELLAIGVDPARATIFVQSHVPEHAELAWVLSCLTGFGEASRMTQFKDKSSRGGQDGASVGLFTYPILMAADILLYRPAQVPVGDDQKQHLELSRDLAQRFNTRYGKTFRLPEPLIPAGGSARIMDLQDPTAKMSKSSAPAGTLYLLDPPAVLAKKIRSAVTDTGRVIVAGPEKPGVTNLLTILSTLSGRPVAEHEAELAGKGYGDLKNAVADEVVAFVEPMQKAYAGWLADTAGLDGVLAAGAVRAREVAARTMTDVRRNIGFLPAAAG